jgi:6-phospho-beta-glucosidase
MRIAILGGSTPFCVPLIDELAAIAEPGSLALNGRSQAGLDAVTSYAEHRLEGRGWTIAGTTSVDGALDGADVVVQQIRFGGLGGRADDERLAEALGVPADETLGPAALRSALRTTPQLRDLAACIHAAAPKALVLNLTNPLSVSTAVLAKNGLRVWGLCELPLVTADSVAERIGSDGDELEWEYTGLNHRGFLCGLRYRGEDVLPILARTLSDRAALGVTEAEVLALKALPLKYFALFAGEAPHGAGRATQLRTLRARALSELERDSTTHPRSLAGREMPWYSRSVGPVLAAVASGDGIDTVLNIEEGGIVQEHRARVAGIECRVRPPSAPPAPVVPWLERFLVHERDVLAAVRDPSSEAVLAACASDPLLPEHKVEEAARLLSDRSEPSPTPVRGRQRGAQRGSIQAQP